MKTALTWLICLIAASGCCDKIDVARSEYLASDLVVVDSTALIAWTRFDVDGPDSAQVAVVDLATDTPGTIYDVPELEAVDIVAGGSTQVAFTHFKSSRTPTGFTTMLLDRGAPISEPIDIAKAAIEPSVAFDGVVYRAIWFETAGVGMALKTRSIDEQGELGEVGDLDLPIASDTVVFVQAVPFDSHRVVIKVVERRYTNNAFAPPRLHVLFLTDGVVSARSTFDPPTPYEPADGQNARCAPYGDQSRRVIGAAVLPDANGVPVYRVFVCGTTKSQPVVAYHIDPATATATIVPLPSVRYGDGEFYSFGHVRGEATDHVIVEGVYGRHLLRPDYSRVKFGDVAYDLQTLDDPHWAHDGTNWLEVFTSQFEANTAVELRRFDQSGLLGGTEIVRDDRRAEICAPATGRQGGCEIGNADGGLIALLVLLIAGRHSRRSRRVAKS